ncbi:MAG: UbiX family flavin prenyltransferase [Oxalobacter sp.]
MNTPLSVKKRFIVAITGASGVIYGIALLKLMQEMPDIETHLVISEAGSITLAHEMGMSVDQANELADHIYHVHDISAAIASGSFACEGMIVAPCSMRTLAAVAHGFCDNLITRSADVTMKERRKLVLVTREAPLNLAHIRNMASVTEMGGIIYPPVPAFYYHPQTIDDIVEQTLRRILQLFNITNSQLSVWKGIKE